MVDVIMKQKYKVLLLIIFITLTIIFIATALILAIMPKETSKNHLWVLLPIWALWTLSLPTFFYVGFSWGDDNL